jgi:hypothetical protein
MYDLVRAIVVEISLPPSYSAAATTFLLLLGILLFTYNPEVRYPSSRSCVPIQNCEIQAVPEHVT